MNRAIEPHASAGPTRPASLPGRASSHAAAKTRNQAVEAFFVRVDSVNPGANIERSACVSVALRSSASYECGDLRLAYSLRPLRVFNQSRAVTMLYNSQHARPTPIVRAVVTPNPQFGSTPLAVRAILRMNGVERVRQDWVWASISGTLGAHQPAHVALSFDASGDPSGLYAYTFEVVIDYGSDIISATTSGELAIVNRSDSEFGRGWWVAGYERLAALTDGTGDLFWIGGDGSTRRYVRQAIPLPNGHFVYRARELSGKDTVTRSSSGEYFRHLEKGAYVRFASDGRHDVTVSSLGRVTTFGSNYCAGRLSYVSLPTPSGNPDLKAWTFIYSGEETATPCVGQPRLIRNGVTYTPGSAYQIIWRTMVADSGGFSAEGATLGYSEANGRIASVTDERGTRTTFVYGAGGLVTSARTPTGVNTDSVLQHFRAGEGSALAAPVLVADAYTALYSPRYPAVQAFTKLWLGPWGNPLKIQDPVGRTTTVLPHATFPLLAARVTAPSGYSHYALYNTNGKLTYMNADPVSGQTPEWYYYYDNAAYPDNLTRTRDAAGVLTAYSYNGPVFNSYPSLSDIENTADAATRVSVTYCANPTGEANCLGLPKTTLSPQNAQGQRSADELTYDALGNLSRSLSHDGKCTEFVNDGVGRVTGSRVRVRGTGPCAGATDPAEWVTTTTIYDGLDRVDSTQTVAPAEGMTPLQTMYSKTRYEGYSDLITSVRRWSAPDDGALGELRDSMQYDALGRVQWKLAQGQSAAELYLYDAAGNVTQRITPKGGLIQMGYDALNRLTTRTMPAVVYDSARVGSAFYAPWDAGKSPVFPRLPLSASFPLSVDGDVATFTYDDDLNSAVGGQATGAIRTANNRAARTSRRYFPNGLIRTDSQWIAAVDDSTDFSQHAYGIAYTYDRASRRTGLEHPAQLAAGLPTATELIAYVAATGRPESIRDLHQRYLQFTFDPAGQLVTQTAPSLRRDLTYTRDGEVATDRVQSLTTTAGAPLPTTGGWARKVALSYDRRGKLLALFDSVGLRTRLTSSYAPIGPLRTSRYQSQVLGITGAVVTDSSTDSIRTDALGNGVGGGTKSTQNVSGSGGWLGGGGTTSSWQSKSFQYATDGTGRLTASAVGFATTQSTYAADGTLERQVTDALQTPAVDAAERFLYYNALGQLSAVDARRGPSPGANPSESTRYILVFDSYRYDALGRRVLTRSQRACPDYQPAYWQECALSIVRRTVWDGARELWEIRMPDTPAYRDTDTAPPPATGWPIYRRPGGTAPTDNAADTFDPNPHYGRVGYVYSSGVDQPIAAHRLGYGDRPFNGGTRRPYKLWNPFALYPVWDVRGEPGLGVTLDGGLWPCEGTGSTKRCVQPMAWTNLWAANGVAVGPVRPAWVGTVLEDKREASGLLYRRNRYLDGATGRFTQPDPIGLAGGLNSYGYAAGDPVNYADPFGLCPFCLGGLLAAGEGTAAAAGVAAVGTRIIASPLGQRALERSTQITARASAQIVGFSRQVSNMLAELSHHDHLSAARLERTGRLSTGYQHAQEVADFANGLRNTTVRLKQIMGNDSVDAEVRAQAAQLLSRTSRLLDQLKEALR